MTMSFYKKLSFLFIYFVIPLPLVGFYLGGFYNFLTILLLFIAIPVIDFWLQDSHNPQTDLEKKSLEANYFKNIILIYVPLQIIFLLTTIILSSRSSLNWYEWIGFTVSTGLITGGIGINLAHELMHKNSFLQQLFSKTLLIMVCYGHFFIEHVRGHHLKVATPQDPATARLGESLYQFLPRTLGGSFKSAWQLEKKRLHNKGYTSLNYHNQFWWILLIPLFICSLCFLYGGVAALFFFLGQALIAILTLEIVNYIEHYGLARKKLSDGSYERVSFQHSWNANHLLSNSLLFHLQRHSDHHTHGAKPYQFLEHLEKSPQLPSGYLGMMILALIPPAWHAIMDKRVLAYYDKETPSSLFLPREDRSF